MLTFFPLIFRFKIFSGWFHGENDRQRYAKYCAIYLYSEGLPLQRQKRFTFYLNKVKHHSHGFEDSNMI